MDASAGREVLRELGGVMGLTFSGRETQPLDVTRLHQIAKSLYQELSRDGAPDSKAEAEQMITDLIEVRNQLRKEKNWPQADMVRQKLEEAGIVLEDTPQGTVWKQKR
jgi:cysteinyl-tRNA synthetase